jgi:CHAT domain-containing protein
LHVATHGYFFPDIPMEDKDQTRFLGMDRQQVVQDPMLRSGLLLTGANRTLKGESSTGENGLLSAAEASLLDLRETELVVLSACETGKGEVKNSEGVYGLRKAFSDAGAQNIIMSLWRVDDKVTQEFMSRFYEIWLNDKTSIREAFNRTQLEIKAKYPQPYYWGAFILVGE